MKEPCEPDARMIACTSRWSEKTSTNWSKTCWKLVRPLALKATSATTCTRLPPHCIASSLTTIAMAVRCAVIASECGTARVSVNAVDDRRSRSMAPSMYSGSMMPCSTILPPSSRIIASSSGAYRSRKNSDSSRKRSRSCFMELRRAWRRTRATARRIDSMSSGVGSGWTTTTLSAGGRDPVASITSCTPRASASTSVRVTTASTLMSAPSACSMRCRMIWCRS